MISNKLKEKQNKQLLTDILESILKREKGGYKTVQDILVFEEFMIDEINKTQPDDPRFKLFKEMSREEMVSAIKLLLVDNNGVQIYLEPKDHLTKNDFLVIDDNMYYILMAKNYNIIDLSDIESIFIQMPDRLKKKYAMKQINRQAYNKLVRFAK